MHKSGLTKKWDSIINQYFTNSDIDVYFFESYNKLYENETEEAVCFYYIKDDFCLFFPFLRRHFTIGQSTVYDFETAYGYGGPLWNIENEKLIIRALNTFKEYCQNHQYIAGFVRFHPLINNQLYFDQIATLLPERKTIDINLEEKIETVWMQEIHTKNRNVIKKGTKSGLRFHLDTTFEQLNNFVTLYNATMQKLSAEEFYYFKDSYYKDFVTTVPGAFLAYVTLEEKIIAAALFFHSKKIGHYHLAGSDTNYLKYAPNNFLLWHVAKEMKKRDVKKFHLGGGTNASQENSLFNFKRKFSKHTNQFYIGKMIFNSTLYQEVCLNWEKKNPEKSSLFKHHLLKYKY